jgi:hypothetical protein
MTTLAFDDILNIIPIVLNPSDCSRCLKPSDTISKLKPKTIKKIIEDCTGQSKLEYIKMKEFFCPKNSQNFEETEKSYMENNKLPIILEYYDDMAFLQMIDIEYLVSYLDKNLTCECVIFPIIYHYHEKQIGHILLILFDNINNLAYIIDSNGISQTEGFKLFEQFIEQTIEIMKGYANSNITYSYISCDLWNSDNIVMNYNYNHSELHDGGNCMMWTFVIIKLLVESKLTPCQIFSDLDKLENEEKIYLIKEYRNFILSNY